MIKTDDFSRGLIERVADTIDRRSLFGKNDKILAAVSGGADSVCMLHILCRLRGRYGIEVYAAHLNHGIRGEEAERDQRYVERLCEELGVECFVKCVDVPRIAKEKKISCEEAGRRARYSFFHELMREHGIDRIATAHNMNDQAETELMRIMRGSGLNGLRGIKYKREDGVVRPILDLKRSEIEEYCRINGLDYKTDSTNLENDYTRNKIRNELIPYIQREFNPNIIETLSNMADTIAEDAEFIDGYAERLNKRLNSPLPGKRVEALHINSLKMTDRAIRSRLILISARNVMGKGYKLEKKHIEQIHELYEKDTPARLNMPGGLVVFNRYGWLEFVKDTDITNNLKNDFCIEVELNKSYNNESAAVSIKNRSYDIEEIGARVSLEVVHKDSLSLGGGEQTLDYDKLVSDGVLDRGLIIRNRRDGDRFIVYKNGKAKKLKSFFIDLKINRDERGRIPLLCCEGEILAVIGVRASEKYKKTRSTENVLVITYERYEDR